MFSLIEEMKTVAEKELLYAKARLQVIEEIEEKLKAASAETAETVVEETCELQPDEGYCKFN